MRLHILERIGFALMVLSLIRVCWPIAETIFDALFRMPTYAIQAVLMAVFGGVALLTGQYLRHNRKHD